jgi:hypothetical protein
MPQVAPQFTIKPAEERSSNLVEKEVSRIVKNVVGDAQWTADLRSLMHSVLARRQTVPVSEADGPSLPELIDSLKSQHRD